MKIAVICGLLLAAVAPSSHAQDLFADSVISYTQGTGASASFNKPASALGAPTSGAAITAPAYSTSQLIGIGNGGELTVQFNSPILNDPADHADGLDFTIFGNEFFVSGTSGITGVYDHPGLSVWVSADNITYYQLVSPYGADDSFPTAGSGNAGLPVNPALTLSSFVGVSASQALAMYNGSAGGASYSISWAETASGASIDLPSISYIQIQGTGGYGYVDAISRVESVPEPGIPALAATALLLASVWRRRSAGWYWLFARK